MSNPFIGQITLMAITYAPRGWHACDGTLINITQNQALFSLIGATYGGNGTSNFALPDLRGRVPVCAGSGPGLSPYALGQHAGTETMSLTAANIPSHTHTASFNMSTTPGGATPAANNFLGGKNDTLMPPTTTLVTLNPGTITVQPNAGGSMPFSIVQPYLALNYYIALQGIFPLAQLTRDHDGHERFRMIRDAASRRLAMRGLARPPSTSNQERSTQYQVEAENRLTHTDTTTAFAAFREAVFEDFHLVMRLRPPLERDTYVAQVVAIGATHGFVFDEATVRAALREGEHAWLTQGAEMIA